MFPRFLCVSQDMIKGGGSLLIVCFHNIAVVFGLGFVLKMKKYKISGTDYL